MNDHIFTIINSLIFMLFGIIAFFLKALLSRIESKMDSMDDRLKSIELQMHAIHELDVTTRDLHDTFTRMKDKVQELQLNCVARHGSGSIRPISGAHRAQP